MKQKTIQTIFILIFFFNNNGFGQIQLKLYGYLNYVKPSDKILINEYETFVNTPHSDTSIIRSYVYNKWTFKSDYQSKIGYSFGGEIVYDLSDRFSIISGIGFEWMLFKYSFETLEFEHITLDSQIINDVPNPPIYTSNFCDIYENSRSDIEDPIEGFEQSTLYLEIPLSVQYAMIKNKINIQLGLLFQTPVLNKLYYEQIRVDREVIFEGVKCRYELEKIKDRSGNSIRNLFVSLNSSLNYALSDRIEVTGMIRTSLNNLFVSEAHQEYPYVTENYKPIRIMLGLKYGLKSAKYEKNKKKKRKRKRRR